MVRDRRTSLAAGEGISDAMRCDAGRKRELAWGCRKEERGGGRKRKCRMGNGEVEGIYSFCI